ncbi:uncharacterized protein GGS22DRAFT_198297 [Annulohypoxylon maeteangense]|uniref:uncharacterized protein n=1 Tax=Annulohypoxylon maeteangense TaxID=1927788 RepID=UPI002007F989|nr:uncharacterized protein GGS22DRAFT_198297 [Annulohypoxylon maeteangense]KAI0880097.1 hypothetical protein GGS22DRAFT_198297 [Annulohypoxylon maeteangense]
MACPVFLRNFSIFLTSSSITIQACVTDEDCSLNGVCSHPSNKCECDLGWKSDDCGQLDLQPATRWTGYNYTNFTLPDFYGTKGNSSWGGSIIQDRFDKNLFHLVIDQFAHGCGLSGWRPFSTVIRAESHTGPAGPYHYAEELLGTFHHNSKVVWSPADEKYLLYTIGIETDTPGTCKSYKWANNISVSSAPDIRGPWGPSKHLLDATNPAPWPLWTQDNPTAEMILGVEDNFIYHAKDFNETFNLIKSMPWNTSDYSDHWTEDPFLWRDRRGNWHILCHWMIDIAERGEKYPRVGGHLFSRSLTGNWTFKLQPAYNTTVYFTDGGRTDYYRRERPQLYFSDDGNLTPLYLINGVQEFNSLASYTLIQPIRTGAKL